MPDFTFALNQSIPITGTSPKNGIEGAYVDLAGVAADYDHPGGPLLVEFFDFYWEYPSGASWMGLDLRLKVNGQPYEPYQRFLDREASARRFSFVSSFPTGQYRFTFEVRSFHWEGPPIVVLINSTATLRLTTQAKVLTFSIQRPQIIEAGVRQPVTVNAYSPDGGAVTVSLASRNTGFVQMETPSPQVIPAGGTSAWFYFWGVSGGYDYLTATADGFQPTVPVEIAIRPVISWCDPSSGRPGSEFEVNGYGFAPGARVSLGVGGYCETVFVSNQRLIARVYDGASPGDRHIYVEVNGMMNAFYQDVGQFNVLG